MADSSTRTAWKYLVAVGFLFLIFDYAFAQTARKEKAPSLEVGVPAVGSLAQGMIHRYEIKLKAGEYIKVVTKELGGSDLLVKFMGPACDLAAGTKALDASNPFSVPEAFKTETIEFVADKSSVYVIELRRHDIVEPAKYQIEIVNKHAASEVDRLRARASAAFNAGEQLRRSDYSVNSFKQALGKFDQALNLWGSVNDPAERASTLNSIGVTYSFLVEHTTSTEYLRKALAVWRATSNLQGEALGLTNVSIRTSTTIESVELMEQALAAWRRLGDRRWEALSLHHLGRAYVDLNKKLEGVKFYLLALNAWQAVEDRTFEVDTWFGLGDTYASLGQVEKSNESYQQVVVLARNSNARNYETAALLRIGESSFLDGDFHTALKYYETALSRSRNTGIANEAYAYYNLGTVYFAFGEQDQALRLFEQSVPLWQSSLIGKAYSLEYIGRIYSTRNREREALECFEEAIRLMGGGASGHGEARIWNDIGLIHARKGEVQQARDCFERALKLTHGEYKDVEGYTLLNLGNLQAQSRNWQGAKTYYEQALALFQELGHKAAQAQARYLIAKSALSQHHLEEAQSQASEAVYAVESLRTRIISDELRYSFLASVREYYELYLNVLMLLHEQNPEASLNRAALEANERGLARSLLDIITHSAVDLREGVDPSLLERERSIRQQLDEQSQRQVSASNTEQQKVAISKQVEDLLAEHHQVQLQIRLNNPRYAALAQPQLLSVKQIQDKVLDDDTMLLEYSVGEEKSFVWAVSKNSLVSVALPRRADIEQAATRFYKLLKTPDSDELEQAAKTLSEQILFPIASKLRGKRLLIVADGVLQYIPFSALALPTTTNKYRPLLSEYEVVHCPSASLLAVLRDEQRNRKPAAQLIGVVADPVFSSTDERVKRGYRRLQKEQSSIRQSSMLRALSDAGLKTGEENLPRLPFTRQEATEIMRLTKPGEGFLALDFNANRQLITSGALSQYRIVHIATHGVLDVKNPELSGLIFSLVNPNGRPQEGFLQLQDLYNLKLNAELVVLSACQTGLGKNVRGEGLIGITRGFMYSGTPRVVTSLWKVDDAATAELMKRFYSAMLKDGLPPAAALRSAQFSLMQTPRFASPTYWSSFILQGEWK